MGVTVKRPVQISKHLLAVMSACRRKWLTSSEVAQKAEVAPRTARAHLSTLVEDGFLDVERVFGGYRYRRSANWKTTELAREVSRVRYALYDAARREQKREYMRAYRARQKGEAAHAV